VNWNHTPDVIRNFVRGLSPYPGAWATIRGKVFKIFLVDTLPSKRKSIENGRIDTDEATFLLVKVKEGWISILELQPEGKKRMTVEEFFRGNKLY
jgi:methionyl-tRNA formyltransferase